MKRTIIFAVLVFLSVSCFAQRKPDIPANQQFYQGARLFATGSFVVVTGFIAHIVITRDAKRYDDNVKLIPASIAMVGVMMQTIGIMQIGNAGLKIDRNLAINTTPDGIGLVYKL